MPVRTKRLAVATSAPAGAGKVVYTAPEGETVILKDIRLQAGSGSAPFCQIAVTSGALAVGVYQDTVPADATRGVSCWVVLAPGDKVSLFSAGGTFSCWLSGTELEGTAD